MTISFNSVPSNIRRPFAYIEFDSSKAVQGDQIQPFKTLLVGQKLASGSATVEVLVRVTSAEQAKTLFGAGSQLHLMCVAYFANNETTETWAVPLADAVASVKAAGTFAFTGVATASGLANLYIGGKRVRVAVAVDDTAAELATALKAAIDADADLPVDDSGTGGNVIVTAKNAGAEGNGIDLRLNYYDDETLPAGLACTITDMASGAGNPDIADAFDALTSDQYNVIVHPYTDESNLIAIDEELEDRWGPITQNDGHAFTAANLAFADLGTLGDDHNSKHLTIVPCGKFPSLPCQVAAAVGGIVALQMAIDPARPLQTLELDGILPPKEGERLTDNERNLLLYDGISALKVNAGGSVVIERLITTYKTNAAGADDPSFLDVEPKYLLSYLRWDLRNFILRKYPRHKLANDGTRFGAGQAIVTPKTLKAECVAKFAEWEDNGLVEDAAQFKNDLIVERNDSDVNRLDIMLLPNLVNQMRVFGGQIAFLL